MNLMYSVISRLIGGGTNFVCRIDRDELAKVPARGPLILAFNHINSLEVPLFHAHLQPRRMIGLAKVETWDNKIMGWLFDLWDSIPVRRGEADLGAIRRCLLALERKEILAVAPEGTRSKDGILLSARPGIALIALHSGAPILPIAHWGGEHFSSNLKKMRRTDFHIRVGNPFILDSNGRRINNQLRQVMADEIMYQIAILMPEKYRGQYMDCTPPPQNYLRFL
jgi:1-acyl-sn-glycerol-3-phosphate acyltransferase